MRIILAALFVLTLSCYATAMNVELGTADPFAVLAGSTVTNTGATTIHGSLGSGRVRPSLVFLPVCERRDDPRQ